MAETIALSTPSTTLVIARLRQICPDNPDYPEAGVWMKELMRVILPLLNLPATENPGRKKIVQFFFFSGFRPQPLWFHGFIPCSGDSGATTGFGYSCMQYYCAPAHCRMYVQPPEG
jgi:hypothetical protein